jgi:hypothetical protein
MTRILAVLMLLAVGFGLAPGRASIAFAQASTQAVARCLFTPGAVVQLEGTPHLFIVDPDGILHWGGDTRALAGRTIDWNTRCEVGLSALRGAQRGDPWLSSGLPKIGEPIYLSKWEDTEPAPTLLHIQSIADVELFGINTANYGNFILDWPVWEQRYGFDVGLLQVGPLASAASFAWPEADRNAYTQLLLNLENVLSAHLFRAYQARLDPALVLPSVALCERAGLTDFERTRNPGYALGITQDCLARLNAGGPPGGPPPGVPIGPGPIAGLPQAPANVRVTVIGASELRVSWDDTLDEIGFRIYGGDPLTPNAPLVANVPANVTSYSVTGLLPNATQCYAVAALGPGGESPTGRPVCATTPSGAGGLPTAPVVIGISQVPTGSGVIGLRVDWTDTSSNETGFQIWRGDQLITTLAANATTYIDYGWSPAMPVCYRVAATSANGQAATSQPSCVGSASGTSWPTAPAGLHLSPAGGGLGLRLDWSDTSANEDGFRILRNGQTIATVAPNIHTYPDFNLSTGVVHCYRVVAFNSAGESASNEACQ